MKTTFEDDEVHIIGGSKWKSRQEVIFEEQSKRPKHFLLLCRKCPVMLWIVLVLLFIIVLAAFVYWGYDAYRYRLDFPISRSQSTVIHSLECTNKAKNDIGVTLSVDTILGVPMKLYHLSGLKARLSSEAPDLTDPKLYFVTRSADYRYDKDKKKMIGDYIVDGQLFSRSSWRAGYFVSCNGKVEIGVGRRPTLRQYVIQHGGSMFRQFALVSSGVKCVSQYLLKGKVSRCAYARTPDGHLYFVETVNRETLYGFSDALAEYGFVDAIYITGGAQTNLFYRNTHGLAQGDYLDDKSHAIVIWTSK